MLAKEYIQTPLYGVFKYILRPRKSLKYRYNTEWALVTGASDGIGEALCHELASSGLNIIMVSRTESKMQKVKADLENQFKV